MKTLGIREYARHREQNKLPGATHRAVQDAIKSGRLSASLTKDRRRIRSAALADREWAETTLADRVPLSGSAAAPAPPDLAAARARRETALAAIAEIELAQLRGELIDRERANQELAGILRVTRDRLRAIPHKVGQRLAREDALRVVPAVAVLIDETLCELVDELEKFLAGNEDEDEDEDEDEGQEREVQR